jgi:hypothetical protein
MDGSGNMILAPDYATAVNALGDSATIMLTQTYTVGQTPSLAAASAAQEAQLVNPVRLYARNALGTVAGYMGLANSNILWLTAVSGAGAPEPGSSLTESFVTVAGDILRAIARQWSLVSGGSDGQVFPDSDFYWHRVGRVSDIYGLMATLLTWR